MNKAYDVAVIGAGIIGLSIAYYLQKSGKKVVLIEKNEIGYGASGACDDMILLQSKKPGILLKMALESLEMYKSLSRELNMDLQFERHGGMILINNEDELKVMTDFVHRQQENGLKVEIIDKQDVFKKQPFVTKNIIASTYSKEDSQVHPLKVMEGFLARSTELGMEFKKGIVIKEIEEKSGYWKIIFENGNFVEANNVVNSAGAWAPDIGKMIGIDIPIKPKKGQIVITEKIPSLGETNVWSAKYIAQKLKTNSKRDVKDKYSHLGLGFSFTKTSDDNYLIGNTREDVGFDKSTTYEAIKLIIKQAIEYFPVLKNVHIIRTFAGLRPAVIDGKPIIGEIEERKGFYIAAGHEGDGIALAPITGKLMADLINGKRLAFDLSELNINRFKRKEAVNAV